VYRPEDLALARHLSARHVSRELVARVAQRLAGATQPATGEQLAADLELGTHAVTTALARLVDVGATRWGPDGHVRWTTDLTLPEVLAASDDESEREREIEGSRLEMMRRYAEHRGCRRSFLLTYFGQDYPGPCGACDNDDGRRAAAAAGGSRPFPVGARVISERWGAGTVQRYDGDQVTVLFDEHGYRDLLVSLVVERRLLRSI
jgi:ATP-dependent DNA helicase RecQ